MKTLPEIFSDNIRRFRKKKHMTQKDLGDLLGYTEKAVSKWEGGTTIPPAETLVSLAALFHTSIDSLLENRLEPEYYVGIDGGGTKSLFALADKEGSVLRTVCLGPCNPMVVGFEEAENILGEGLKELCDGIPFSLISLFAGIAGITADTNPEILTRFFSDFRIGSVKIGNDSENILSAGLGDADGIAVIMGTGSNAFSQKDGKLRQFGGCGYLFDDGGNGFSIARDAIHAALYDENGCGPHTMLTSLFARENGCSSHEMMPNYYKKGNRFIASYAHLVDTAFDAGDKVAAGILDRNMAQIAILIDAALGEFEPSDYPIRVVCVGGLTKRSKVLFGMIEKHLKNKDAVRLEVYPYEPVLGALRLAGAPVRTDWDNGITREKTV